MDTFFQDINIAELKTQLISYLPNVLSALLIFIIGYVVYKMGKKPISIALARAGLEEALIRIILKIAKVFVVVILFVMALGQLGVNVGAALAGIGVIGIAIGFAAQDSLSNIIAGFLIFIDKPFKVGDYISHEDKYGRVQLITLRSTRIRTQDNTYVVIPNQKIINDVVVDHSTNGETRVVVKVGIAYKESIDEARNVLLQEIKNMEDVLEIPAPDVVVDELAESSVKLLVHVWVNDASIERKTHFALTEVCKKSLDKAGIEIAFPHMRLFVEDIKDSVIDKLSKSPTS